MTVYRCTLLKWAKDLSGTGAHLYGGRWNSPGLHMLYTAENNVLAAFEVALRIPLEHISKEYVMVPLDLPDVEIHSPVVAKNWYKDIRHTRGIGDDFLKQKKHLIMKVPSALISDAFNYLVNPEHPQAANIRVQKPRPILFDQRLTALMKSKNG